MIWDNENIQLVEPTWLHDYS